MPFFVYILKCSDGSYYTGSTNDVVNRVDQHEAGTDKKAYTFSRRPIQLMWVGEFETKFEAYLFEKQVKGWNRNKKEALIQDDWETIHKIVKNERKNKEGKS